MHHLVAYGATVASTAETELPALADGVITVANTHYLPQRDTKLLFAAYAALLISRARISQPSVDAITSPYLHDISLAVDFGDPQRIADYSDDPLVLAKQEEVRVFGTNSAATSGVSLALLGLDYGQIARPAGNVLTIRGTATGTLAVNAWTNVGAITWQNSLKTGVYAVVGGFSQSAGAKAWRLIFPEQVPRPGGPGIILETGRVHPLFRMGGLGVWGTFANYAMPQVEMISASADTAENIYLDIVRIG